MQKEIKTFLKKLVAEIENMGLDIKSLKIDHIAYSASSVNEYEKVKSEFLKNGHLTKEPVIGGRRVGVIKFFVPPVYNNTKIQAMEIIEPRKGEKSFSGWEHAEFLVKDFDNIINKYPNINWVIKDKDRSEFARIKIILPSGKEIKFLKTPILEEI